MDAAGPRVIGFALALASLIATTACVGDEQASPQRGATETATARAAAPPAAAATSTPPDARAVPHVSLQRLMRTRFDGRALRVVRTIERTGTSTTYAIRYRGGGLRLSGIMLVPRGSGPFPVLVLNHGYIDPAVYRTGRGFERAQRFLVANGFVVVHVDYRNHAESDDDPRSDVELRLGYAEDAVNAVLAVKRSSLPYLDGDRVGMIGRSMGGGVTLNALVARPDIVDAAAIFASVSSDAVDNFDRWIRRRPALAERILETYGSPEDNPSFWEGVSPRTFFERIEVPVMVHHGTDDETCPIRWAEETVDALRADGVDVTYHRYRGEGHQFYDQYARSMRRTVAFMRRHLG